MPRILTNFKYNSNSPNFERDQVKLKSSLGKATLDDYDLGHLVYCLEDKKIYIFQPLEETPGVYTKHNNITGYFLPFEKTLTTKDETITQRLVVAFCSVPDPEEIPNYPIGFEWNLKTDEIMVPQTQEGTQWYLDDTDLEPYIWMSIGSFTSDKPNNPTWSKPIRITGAVGAVGVAQFKSYVFKWSQSKPNKPEDGSGSYDNPVPTGWSDGVPAQTDSETRLWMTTAWFENSDDWSAIWTEPQVVSDTADFDVEFSSVENNPGNPTSNPDNWSNDADETTIWMATRKLSQGKWSNWTIAKIKGEKGQDGTSIKIGGSYKDLDAFKKDFWDATNDKWKAPTTEDNSYIVAGDLYVWDGDSWENVGPFRGEDGVSAYVHIKYANKGEKAEGKYDFKATIGETEVYLKLTGANGEDPGDYIGTFADSIVDDPGLSEDRFGKYIWKYWKGEDGYGYEYIYIRTKTATAPSTPTTSNNTNDYVPDTDYDPDWTDNATGVSVDYPFDEKVLTHYG